MTSSDLINEYEGIISNCDLIHKEIDYEKKIYLENIRDIDTKYNNTINKLNLLEKDILDKKNQLDNEEIIININDLIEEISLFNINKKDIVINIDVLLEEYIDIINYEDLINKVGKTKLCMKSNIFICVSKKIYTNIFDTMVNINSLNIPNEEILMKIRYYNPLINKPIYIELNNNILNIDITIKLKELWEIKNKNEILYKSIINTISKNNKILRKERKNAIF